MSFDETYIDWEYRFYSQICVSNSEFESAVPNNLDNKIIESHGLALWFRKVGIYASEQAHLLICRHN